MSRMSRTGVARCILAAGALSAVGSAVAAHPMITEDSGTQGQGRYQIELQFEHGRDEQAGTTEKSQNSALVLSYGAHERVDVIVTLPHERAQTVANGNTEEVKGGGDVSTDVKWRFYDAQPLSLAIKTGFTFPTGDDDYGIGTGNINVSGFLVGSLGYERFALHVMTGLIGNENDVGEKSLLRHLSAGATVNLGNLAFVADVGRYTAADRNYDRHAAFGLLGAVWSLNDNLDLDVGVKWGLTEAETDRAWLAGMAYRF